MAISRISHIVSYLTRMLVSRKVSVDDEISTVSFNYLMYTYNRGF